MLDSNGQLLAMGFNAHRRLERDISEMLGLAKGMLADGQVSDAETILLHEWMDAHPDVVSCWPGDYIAVRLKNVLRDGEITEVERADLAELLSQLVGGDAGIIGSDNASTALPFDRPPPNLVYPESVFVLTGKFAFGPRTACQRAVVQLGGSCDADVTMRTKYLVIGTFGSRDWVHTSHGRKIEKAVDYRERGAKISIVPEQHWISTLSA